MNKQGRLINGVLTGGIEWTKRQLPDGTWRCGYTWNPVGGCAHACRWEMPDGSTAICYAELVANKFTSAYPEGFDHHYWRPAILEEPLRIKEPSRIFLDSMSDLMGHWVPEEQILQVLDVCRRAPQHEFQLLTKNAPRLAAFEFPANVWVGVSAPPTEFMGHTFTDAHRAAYVTRALRALREARCAVRWMSIEPLSFDIAPLLTEAGLDWAVIGAATKGRTVYQPKSEWVHNAIEVLRAQGAAIFFKGNLQGNAAADPWLEEFPQ